jgi:hypothetical protein
MNHSPKVRVLTEVHEGNEEWAPASFPSLPSVTSRETDLFCGLGAKR